MKKVKLVYNPNSGERSIVNKLDCIIETYQSYGYILIPYRLNKQNPIKDAFIDLNEDYDHILISGGDGTVDMVLNVMKELEINKPIGILPTGTANDFANALSLPFNVKESIENIINSSPKKIDTVSYTHLTLPTIA